MWNYFTSSFTILINNHSKEAKFQSPKTSWVNYKQHLLLRSFFSPGYTYNFITVLGSFIGFLMIYLVMLFVFLSSIYHNILKAGIWFSNSFYIYQGFYVLPLNGVLKCLRKDTKCCGGDGCFTTSRNWQDRIFSRGALREHIYLFLFIAFCYSYKEQAIETHWTLI